MKNSRRLTDEDVRAQCAKPWSPPGSVRVRLGLGDTRPYVLSHQAYRVGSFAPKTHARDKITPTSSRLGKLIVRRVDKYWRNPGSIGSEDAAW